MQFEKKIKGKLTTVKVEISKDAETGLNPKYNIRFTRDGKDGYAVIDGTKVGLEVEKLLTNMISNEILRKVNAK